VLLGGKGAIVNSIELKRMNYGVASQIYQAVPAQIDFTAKKPRCQELAALCDIVVS